MCMAMGMYMFGCLLAGFSQSIITLIIFRGIAGAGGGGIVSVLQIVISDVVSLRDRLVPQRKPQDVLIPFAEESTSESSEVSYP